MTPRRRTRPMCHSACGSRVSGSKYYYYCSPPLQAAWVPVPVWKDRKRLNFCTEKRTIWPRHAPSVVPSPHEFPIASGEWWHRLVWPKFLCDIVSGIAMPRGFAMDCCWNCRVSQWVWGWEVVVVRKHCCCRPTNVVVARVYIRGISIYRPIPMCHHQMGQPSSYVLWQPLLYYHHGHRVCVRAHLPSHQMWPNWTCHIGGVHKPNHFILNFPHGW